VTIGGSKSPGSFPFLGGDSMTKPTIAVLVSWAKPSAGRPAHAQDSGGRAPAGPFGQVAFGPSLPPAGRFRAADAERSVREGRSRPEAMAGARRTSVVSAGLACTWVIPPSSFRMPPPASPRARPLRPRGCNPLDATCSALPTVGGAKSAALDDRHSNIDYISSAYNSGRELRRTSAIGRTELPILHTSRVTRGSCSGS
jgi:hypothetical protein